MNENERFVHDMLVERGYTVLRGGWPDFLVMRPDGHTFAIEWKEPGDRVRMNQERMHDGLALAGIPTIVTGSLDDVLAFRPPAAYEVQNAALLRVRNRLEGQVESLNRDVRTLMAERNSMFEQWRELREKRDALNAELETARRLRRSLAGIDE